jgi:hypothetical protein
VSLKAAARAPVWTRTALRSAPNLGSAQSRLGGRPELAPFEAHLGHGAPVVMVVARGGAPHRQPADGGRPLRPGCRGTQGPHHVEGGGVGFALEGVVGVAHPQRALGHGHHAGHGPVAGRLLQVHPHTADRSLSHTSALPLDAPVVPPLPRP